MNYEQRRYDGYPRPSRIGLIITLCLVLAGTVWIDLYDVPEGLRRIACDFGVTSWQRMLTLPKIYWALPILLAEMAFWVRLLVWLWPVPKLAKPVPSDWVLILLVFLLGVAISLYSVAALQPGPWYTCMTSPG